MIILTGAEGAVINKIKIYDHSVYICISAFFMAFGLGSIATALPFVVSFMGGTEWVVGVCAGANWIAYLTGLTLAVRLLPKLNDRKTAIAGCSGMLMASIGMWLIVKEYQQGCSYCNIPALTAFLMISGGSMAIFWPPLMAWVSHGKDGINLNKRLGHYNLSWTLGLTISPFAIGYMLEKSITVSMASIMFMMTIAFAGVITAYFADSTKLKPQKIDELTGAQQHHIKRTLPKFRIIARLGLLGIFICMAVLRTQFALLFKKELGFTESDYGLIITILFISVGLTFFKLSRTDKWHYRISFLAIAQIIIIVTMLLIMAGVKIRAGLWFYSVPAIIFGISHSAVFLSHQYYSLCGAKNRSRQMAIHEMVLSSGNLCGSVAAGQTAAFFGLKYAPYMMGIAAVLIISAAQAVTWILVKKRKNDPFGTFNREIIKG